MKIRRRVCTWICTLAMLASALLPFTAQAGYALSGEAAWLEVCSANGVERMRADGEPLDEAPAAHQTPCKWCKHQFGLGILPVREILPSDPFPKGAVRLPAPRGFLRPHPVWAAAQARAPPRI